MEVVLKFGIRIRKFFADAGYDSNATRLLIVQKLRAVPFIPLNVGGSKGHSKVEKMERRKRLAAEFCKKNFIMKSWADPDLKRFDDEYDRRTFSEQLFSIGKGSLDMDCLMHRGVEWATLH